MQISVWASFACLYLYLIIINIIVLKSPLSLFSVAHDHWGHSIILVCKTVLPPMQVSLHLIAVKYTRYVVPCMFHDCVKEVSWYEDLMRLFLYCGGDRHTVTVG